MFSVHSANWFSYIILILYFPICIYVLRSYSAVRGTLFLMFFAILFLPSRVAIDLPLLPKLGKESIAFLGIATGLYSFHPKVFRRAGFGKPLDILIVLIGVGAVLTALTNTDAIRFGPHVVPGMPPLEMFTGTLSQLILYSLPFYLGRALIRTEADLRDVFGALIIAGLVYTLFLTIELRLSPQLHRTLYGFHQNIFSTLNRWGGYRPMAFMESGIAVAVFMVNTLMAALTFARLRLSVGFIPLRLGAPWLFVYLILCKSVASIVWGLIFTPLMLLLRPRAIALVAALLAMLVLTYPGLRITNTFPWQGIVEVAASWDPDRARSLNYRFENDENMLVRARERPLFGWGGYRRNWAYDETTGEHLTVPDGAWIIRFSSFGVLGFYALYLMYIAPVLLAWIRLGRIRDPQVQMMIASLMLIVIIRAVDQLPNGLYSSYPVFLGGALYTLTTALPVEAKRRKRAKRSPRKRREPVIDQPEITPDPAPQPSHSSGPASTAELLGVRRDD